MRFTLDDTGCVFDGANRGWQISGHVVELALAHGFGKGATRAGTMRNRAVLRAILRAFYASEDTVKFRHRSRSGSYTETIDDVSGLINDQGGYCDDAVDYLNTLAPDGASFGFHDGSFYLAATEWWEES